MRTAWGPILRSSGLSTGCVASVSHFSHPYNGDTNSTYFLGLL